MTLSSRIRTMSAPHWLALFSLILAGWVLLYAMALPPNALEMSRIYGADFWRSLCVVEPDKAGFLGLFAMWAVMSAAMMAPTALPTFATYDDLIDSDAGSQRGFLELIAGYLVIWLGFAAIAAAGQLVLFRAGLLSPLGQSVSPWLTSVLLIGAGAYQFSSLKDACLNQCRQPMAFFMQYWRETRWNDAALGLRLGAICLGCCWALMFLGFVGGVMNLAFMGLATLIMIFEKLPDIGRYLTRPLGWALIAGGALALIQGG